MLVICVGELLWDIIDGERFFGGAPVNAAAQLARLGVEAEMVTAVGQDELGAKSCDRLNELRVGRRFLKFSTAPTGTAIVRTDLEGDERFALTAPAAYDYAELTAADIERAAALRPDAVVFGTLAQFRSQTVRSSVSRLLEALPDAEALYDVNLRQHLYSRGLLEDLIRRCTILKLNDDEVDTLSLEIFGELMDMERFSRFVFDECPEGPHTVVVTRGASGADVFAASGQHYHADGIPVTVADTVGAGDAFAAGYLEAWLRTGSRREALDAGNRLGAATAAHRGAL